MIKLLVVGGCLAAFCRTYLREFQWVITPARAFLVGAIGAAVWIGLCALAIEPRLLDWLGWKGTVFGERSHFDPFRELPSAVERGIFLAARLALLIGVVPLAEEAFLRGWLMRFAHAPEWWRVRLPELGRTAIFCGTLYGVVSHPQEALAAVAWFNWISWFMLRDGKFWNCVLAHAMTNGLLGAYALALGRWELW
jgi:hypothetical protein